MMAVVTASRGGEVDWGKAEELKFSWRSVANKRIYAETHGYDLYVVIEPLQVGHRGSQQCCIVMARAQPGKATSAVSLVSPVPLVPSAVPC
jgi:hypothetical protein